MASLTASDKLQVVSTGDSALQLRLAGEWVVGEAIPPVDDILKTLASEPLPRRLDFEASGLGRWDSLLITFLVKLIDYCAAHAVDANREGLPQGVRGLLALAYAVPERQGARRESASRMAHPDRQPGPAIFFRRVYTCLLQLKWYL